MPFNKKKIFSLAKGFFGKAKNCNKIARQSVEKALQYQYRDRRTKKRDFKELWIMRIGAGAREHGLTYSTLMHGLKSDNILLNRKSLAELAMSEPFSFKALVDRVKEMRGML